MKKVIFKLSCKIIYFNNMKLYWFIRNRLPDIYNVCTRVYGWSCSN